MLVVAEKPSVARDIAQVLGARTRGEGHFSGEGWVVTWAIGHLVALAEVLWRELREHQIGVSVLCPMRVGTNIGQSERNRQADYGETAPGARVADQDSGNSDLAGRVLDVGDVAALTVDAIEQNRLYVLPHEESRESIRRRFARIDKTFDDQPTISAAD